MRLVTLPLPLSFLFQAPKSFNLTSNADLGRMLPLEGPQFLVPGWGQHPPGWGCKLSWAGWGALPRDAASQEAEFVFLTSRRDPQGRHDGQPGLPVVTIVFRRHIAALTKRMHQE